MMDPEDPAAEFYKSDSPKSDWGNGGFSGGRVFASEEEAFAAPTSEDEYLETLDEKDDVDED